MSTNAWLAKFLTASQAIESASLQHLQSVEQKRKSKQISPLTTFVVGEYVLLAFPDSDVMKKAENKLNGRHTGPYRVTRKIDNNSYQLQSLLTEKLKLYSSDPDRANDKVSRSAGQRPEARSTGLIV